MRSTVQVAHPPHSLRGTTWSKLLDGSLWTGAHIVCEHPSVPCASKPPSWAAVMPYQEAPRALVVPRALTLVCTQAC
jgi:hypothetical protein